jgi:biotin transporter BioY
MQNFTYIDIIRPNIKRDAFIFDVMLVIGASIFITISAQLSINVPYSPVPITGQTFAVILAGAFLGSRRGSLAVIAYLMEGISGLPVFAHAHFGLAHLIGPTGGYLIGFIPAAFICGYIAERNMGRSFLGALALMTIGTIIIFIFGISWLSIIFRAENALIIGFYPYVIGAIIKIILAAIVFSGSWKFTKFKQKL